MFGWDGTHTIQTANNPMDQLVPCTQTFKCKGTQREKARESISQRGGIMWHGNRNCSRLLSPSKQMGALAKRPHLGLSIAIPRGERDSMYTASINSAIHSLSRTVGEHFRKEHPAEHEQTDTQPGCTCMRTLNISNIDKVLCWRRSFSLSPSPH